MILFHGHGCYDTQPLNPGARIWISISLPSRMPQGLHAHMVEQREVILKDPIGAGHGGSRLKSQHFGCHYSILRYYKRERPGDVALSKPACAHCSPAPLVSLLSCLGLLSDGELTGEGLLRAQPGLQEHSNEPTPPGESP